MEVFWICWGILGWMDGMDGWIKKHPPGIETRKKGEKMKNNEEHEKTMKIEKEHEKQTKT